MVCIDLCVYVCVCVSGGRQAEKKERERVCVDVHVCECLGKKQTVQQTTGSSV
jgi:hypothetical protein